MSVGTEQQGGGFSLRALEDRALLHVDRSQEAAEAAAVSVGPFRTENLRLAEIHSSLAATVASIIAARTKRWRPRPDRAADIEETRGGR